MPMVRNAEPSPKANREAALKRVREENVGLMRRVAETVLIAAATIAAISMPVTPTGSEWTMK